MTSFFFILFAFGCSKGLLLEKNGEGLNRSLEGDALHGIEEGAGDEEVFLGRYEQSGPRDFGSAEKGMPGDGSTGSFSAEPFSGTGPGQEGDAGEKDFIARGYEKPEPRDFGSAEQGMPDNGSTGSFTADPLTGTGSETGGEREIASAPESTPPHFTEENIGSQDFGSAQPGMPGNGSTGSFSAEPFSAESLTAESSSKEPLDAKPFSEESIKDETGGIGQPMEEEGERDKTPDFAEPFLTNNGENEVASLVEQDEVRRRLLPYTTTDRIQDIHFAFDRSDLNGLAKEILEKNAAYLKSHPNSNIEIQGHCDERGSNSYNISLGERRVRSTQSYLISLGVDESRIHAISYGEERPFCLESNEDCWYQNRRAHFLIAE